MKSLSKLLQNSKKEEAVVQPAVLGDQDRSQGGVSQPLQTWTLSLLMATGR